MKKPGCPGFLVFASRVLIERLDVGGLIPLGAGGDVEGDFLVFAKALVSLALNRREMREEVLAAAIGRDKAEALAVVEPLNGTCAHVYCSYE